MNPEDKNLPSLRTAMTQLRASQNADDALTKSEKFIEVCQHILKAEWDVLKANMQKLDQLDHAKAD
jgi:hypothetical protein